MAAPAQTRQYLPAGARRGQIVRDARRLFARRGFAAVSTAEIAAATGVSWALVAHYFGDKRGLYIAVLRSIADPALEFTVPDGPLEARIAAAVEFALSTIERSEESWLAAVGGWDVESDPEIAEVLEQGRERAVDLVLDVVGADAPDLDADQLRALARCAVTLCETAAQEWLRRGRLTREDAAALVTHGLVGLLSAADRALTSAR